MILLPLLLVMIFSLRVCLFCRADYIRRGSACQPIARDRLTLSCVDDFTDKQNRLPHCDQTYEMIASDQRLGG